MQRQPRTTTAATNTCGSGRLMNVYLRLCNRPLPPLPDHQRRPGSALPPGPRSPIGKAVVDDRHYYSRSAAAAPVVQPTAIPRAECIICYTWTDIRKMYQARGCRHSVCRGCLQRYFETYIETARDAYQHIPCPFGPECRAHYETLDILPQIMSRSQVDAWWLTVFQRSNVLDSLGTCPYEGCNQIFELGDKPRNPLQYVAKCFGCGRGICLRCEDRWHPGMPCIEGRHAERWNWPISETERRLLADQVNPKVLVSLAESKGWIPCPKCHQIVERTSGCPFIRCICEQEL
ncbi:hypothetical protein BX666DRAFT_1887749 [Dichotomocladium elegans]|nr:hypothetical protein BX666DRAFT_1887749 [Dichotomocladium elegans]